MSRIVLLTLACSAALAAAQYSNSDISPTPSPNVRAKRQPSFHDRDEDPFVGPEEGRENNDRFNGEQFPHRRESDSDSRGDKDDSLEDFRPNDQPQFIPAPLPGQAQPVFPGQAQASFPGQVQQPPFFGPGPVVVQSPSGPVLVPQPQPLFPGQVAAPFPGEVQGPFLDQNQQRFPDQVRPPLSAPISNPFFRSSGPVDPTPIPPAQPIVLPIAAEEGHGVAVEEEIPQPLPQPLAQQGFRPSGPVDRFTTTTTTTPSPRPSSGFFPSPVLTCSSVRCPSGASCRMENNRRTRRDEPVCVFTGANSPTSCAQVRCSTGFECEMQESSSCSGRQCPQNPVCVQTVVTTPAPIVSCDTVRCSAGTVCRIQTVDHCTFAPCAMQTVCVSPCAAVSCPTNSQCKVDERSLTASCVPNVPAQSPPSACAGVRCGFGQRCAVVKNCSWSRECRDEARCINFN